jgi:hypothetical protein
MAAFEEHCRDCERVLGSRCEDVNRWIDAEFKKYGANHRFARHHWRGVDEAEKLYGALGRKAAMVHILKDCGRVPQAREWNEKVSTLIVTPAEGLMGYWPDANEFDRKARELLSERR